jgi:hypothetical protein
MLGGLPFSAHTFVVVFCCPNHASPWKQISTVSSATCPGISHIKDAANKTQTANYLKVSRRSVNDRVNRLNGEGIDGLKEKPKPGRPCSLSELECRGV